MQVRKITIGLLIAIAIIGSQLSVSSLARSPRANGDTRFTVRIGNISSKDGQTASDGTRWPFALSPGLRVAHDKTKGSSFYNRTAGLFRVTVSPEEKM